MMNTKVMHILVASENPVKIKASEIAFSKVFDNHSFNIEGVSVNSDVSDQPMSNEETFLGARNRALNAQKLNTKADFVVGIEGGVDSFDNSLESFAWIYIIHSNLNKTSKAKTASFILPPKVVQLVNEGLELGEANDIIFKKHHSKKKNGAVGLLTNDLLTRTSYYSDAIILALIPFIQPDLYPNP